MPTLKGRRLTVYDIVTKLSYEPTIKQALEDYEINEKEAKAAVNYCMNLCCKSDNDRLNFCNGCTLNAEQDNTEFDENKYEEIAYNLTVTKDSSFIYLGSLEDLKNENKGKPGWLIAKNINDNLKDFND